MTDTQVKACISIISLIAGFFIRQFFYTKKESFDVKKQKLELSNKFAIDIDDAGRVWISAIQEYYDAVSPTVQTFTNVAISGERYFTMIKAMSDAYHAGMLAPMAVTKTHSKTIKDAARRLLPQHYDILKKIAEKNGFTYNDKPDIDNYRSIYDADSRLNPI